MDMIQEKIKDVFDALQELDIKGTPNNVRILDAVYVTLREIYAELNNEEAGGEHAAG